LWHCETENRLQWVREVTFDEDRSRIRTGHGAQVMARWVQKLKRHAATW
jgi:predicted transposase YbfD/YdcC